MPTRILILRFSSIGDIVLTTPVIRCLKEQVRDVEIHFICKEAFAPILENNPHISRLWTFQKSPEERLHELKTLGFDEVIDLQNNLRSLKLSRKLGKKVSKLNKLNFKKWLLVNFGVNKLPERHVVDRYMDTVYHLGVRNDGKGLDYFFPAGFDPNSLSELSLPEEYFVFALGGAHEGKRMTSAQWAGVVNRADKKVVLIGGKQDERQAEEIMKATDDYAINLSGKLELYESAWVISKSEGVVSGDTGMMHIASAFKRKIVSVWGCTVPDFGMYPYLADPASRIIEPEGLDKRPCSKLGNRCKYGMENKCISTIAPAVIAEALLEITSG